MSCKNMNNSSEHFLDSKKQKVSHSICNNSPAMTDKWVFDPTLTESSSNNTSYFSSSSTGNSEFFAAYEPVEFFHLHDIPNSDIYHDQDNVPLPQGWKIAGRKRSIFELETNIHTLSELYSTLVDLRNQLPDTVALEVEEPFHKNAPCFLRTRSSTTDENNTRFSISRSGSSNNNYSFPSSPSTPSPSNGSVKSSEDDALYDRFISTYPEFIFELLIELYADCICYKRTQPKKLQGLYRQSKLNQAHACAIYAYGSLHALLCHPEQFGIYSFMNQLASDAYQVAFDLVEFDSMDAVTIETLVILYQYLIILGHDGEARNLLCVAQRQMELLLTDNRKYDTGQDVHRLLVWMSELDWSFALTKFSAPLIEYSRAKASLDLITPISPNHQNDRLYVKATKFRIKGLQILLFSDEKQAAATDMKPHQKLNHWRTKYLETFLYKRQSNQSYTAEDKEALRLHAMYFSGMLEFHQQRMMDGFELVKIWESRDQWTDYFGQTNCMQITTEQSQVEKGLYRCMNAAYGFIQVIRLLLEEKDRCTLPQMMDTLSAACTVLYFGNKVIISNKEMIQKSEEALSFVVYAFLTSTTYSLMQCPRIDKFVKKWGPLIS